MMNRNGKITFGARLRQLRNAAGLSQRELADRAGVHFTYISKIETANLDWGDYPSEALIHRLEYQLDCQLGELTELAGIMPPKVYRRVMARLDDFRRLASLSDKGLDEIMRRLQ